MRRNRLVGPLALLAVLVLAACGGAGSDHHGTTGSSRSARSRPTSTTVPISDLLDPQGTKYLGVEVPGAPKSLRKVRTFATAIGRKPDLIGEYIGFGQRFDPAAVRAAWAYGAMTYVAWEPYGTTVADIASGNDNSYIDRFAKSVRAVGLPVALSFGHEMNGNWYPWGTSDSTPAQFVAAWRLIHAIFTAVRANNVIWVWNPNVISANPGVSLKPYWPGDSYVDWVGITGYFDTGAYATFKTLFGPTMTQIRTFTSEPVLIAETSVPTGPGEAATARSLVAGVRRSNVIGLIWFNYDKAGQDWRLASRPALRAAMAGQLASVPLVQVSRR
ncbi:MAG TPA: glycosyl hydrolase [Streptosporangiaceae bacterium]|nr:glycosyl hydrolase [Streptosporangiaceae bacterium]